MTPTIVGQCLYSGHPRSPHGPLDVLLLDSESLGDVLAPQRLPALLEVPPLQPHLPQVLDRDVLGLRVGQAGDADVDGGLPVGARAVGVGGQGAVVAEQVVAVVLELQFKGFSRRHWKVP